MVVSLVHCDDVCVRAPRGRVRTDRECVGRTAFIQYEVCVCVVHVCVASALVTSFSLYLNI